MKLVTAVVTPSQFEAIHEALTTFGITGLTLSEVFLTRIRTGERGLDAL